MPVMHKGNWHGRGPLTLRRRDQVPLGRCRRPPEPLDFGTDQKAVIRLAGALLPGQNDEWAVQRAGCITWKPSPRSAMTPPVRRPLQPDQVANAAQERRACTMQQGTTHGLLIESQGSSQGAGCSLRNHRHRWRRVGRRESQVRIALRQTGSAEAGRSSLTSPQR